MSLQGKYNENILFLILELQAQKNYNTKLEMVNNNNLKTIQELKQRVLTMYSFNENEKNNNQNQISTLSSKFKEQQEAHQKLNERFQINDHKYLLNEQQIEELIESVKKKEVTSIDMKVLNEENRILQEKVQELENQLFKANLSKEDKKKLLKNRIKDFENMGFDFEQENKRIKKELEKEQQRNFELETHLQNLNDKIFDQQQNYTDQDYKDKYWKLKDEYDQFIINTKKQQREQSSKLLQLQKNEIVIDKDKVIQDLTQQINEMENEIRDLKSKIQVLLSYEKVFPDQQQRFRFHQNELQAIELQKGMRARDYIQQLEEENSKLNAILNNNHSQYTEQNQSNLFSLKERESEISEDPNQKYFESIKNTVQKEQPLVDQFNNYLQIEKKIGDELGQQRINILQDKLQALKNLNYIIDDENQNLLRLESDLNNFKQNHPLQREEIFNKQQQVERTIDNHSNYQIQLQKQQNDLLDQLFLIINKEKEVLQQQIKDEDNKSLKLMQIRTNPKLHETSDSQKIKKNSSEKNFVEGFIERIDKDIDDVFENLLNGYEQQVLINRRIQEVIRFLNNQFPQKIQMNSQTKQNELIKQQKFNQLLGESQQIKQLQNQVTILEDQNNKIKKEIKGELYKVDSIRVVNNFDQPKNVQSLKNNHIQSHKIFYKTDQLNFKPNQQAPMRVENFQSFNQNKEQMEKTQKKLPSQPVEQPIEQSYQNSNHVPLIYSVSTNKQSQNNPIMQNQQQSLSSLQYSNSNYQQKPIIYIHDHQTNRSSSQNNTSTSSQNPFNQNQLQNTNINSQHIRQPKQNVEVYHSGVKISPTQSQKKLKPLNLDDSLLDDPDEKSPQKQISENNQKIYNKEYNKERGITFGKGYFEQVEVSKDKLDNQNLIVKKQGLFKSQKTSQRTNSQDTISKAFSDIPHYQRFIDKLSNIDLKDNPYFQNQQVQPSDQQQIFQKRNQNLQFNEQSNNITDTPKISSNQSHQQQIFNFSNKNQSPVNDLINKEQRQNQQFIYQTDIKAETIRPNKDKLLNDFDDDSSYYPQQFYYNSLENDNQKQNDSSLNSKSKHFSSFKPYQEPISDSQFSLQPKDFDQMKQVLKNLHQQVSLWNEEISYQDYDQLPDIIMKLKKKFDHIFELYQQKEIDYEQLQHRVNLLSQENQEILTKLEFYYTKIKERGNYEEEAEIQKLKNQIRELEIQLKINLDKESNEKRPHVEIEHLTEENQKLLSELQEEKKRNILNKGDTLIIDLETEIKLLKEENTRLQTDNSQLNQFKQTNKKGIDFQSRIQHQEHLLDKQANQILNLQQKLNEYQIEDTGNSTLYYQSVIKELKEQVSMEKQRVSELIEKLKQQQLNRKNSLRQSKDFTFYQDMISDLQEQNSMLKEQVRKIPQMKLTIKQLQEQIRILEKERTVQIRENNDDEIKRLNQLIEKFKKKIRDMTEEMEYLEQTNKSLQIQRDQFQMELQAIQEQNFELQDQNDKNLKQISRLQTKLFIMFTELERLQVQSSRFIKQFKLCQQILVLILIYILIFNSSVIQRNDTKIRTYRVRLQKQVKRDPRKTLLYRKRVKFNNKYHMAWTQMSSGFIWGGLSGAALGAVFGIIPAIRYRSASIMVVSMLISGGMFSCIGGFGSLLHSR